MEFEKLYNTLIENEDYETKPNDELKMGLEVEKEHTDLLNKFKDFCKQNNVQMPLTDEEFFETIAKAHLKEFKTYYTALKKMEDGLKNAK